MPSYTLTYFERIQRTVEAPDLATAGSLARDFVKTLNGGGATDHPPYRLHSVVRLDHKPRTMPVAPT